MFERARHAEGRKVLGKRTERFLPRFLLPTLRPQELLGIFFASQNCTRQSDANTARNRAVATPRHLPFFSFLFSDTPSTTESHSLTSACRVIGAFGAPRRAHTEERRERRPAFKDRSVLQFLQRRSVLLCNKSSLLSTRTEPGTDTRGALKLADFATGSQGAHTPIAATPAVTLL